jgi:uncharacterized repeat protein (TIGR01451 family)
MTAVRRLNHSLAPRPARWIGARVAWAGVAGVLALFVMSLGAPAAMAAPPTVVFFEDFENTGTPPVLLTDYQGSAPAHNATYNAAAGWLRDCNGWVLTGASPQPADTFNCPFWGSLQTLAASLGTYQGLADPNTNHAVAAYTNSCGDPTSPQFGTTLVCGGANQIQWETENPITVPANRYYTFSVDAAYLSCQVAHPLFDFSIVAGGTEIPTSPTPIDGCVNGNGAYSFASPGSIFLTETSIGLRMRNRQGSTVGNDGAFDNVRLLDVTPVMHKSFSTPSLDVGQAATLTFTIENTDELAAKNGWSFTDNLPSGLVVADPAAASTTCPSGQLTAAAGSGSVAMTGNLNAGQASCTVTVNVTSSSPGTYENCPANVTTVGIDPPACAPVTFNAADVEIVKSSTSPLVAGEVATLRLTATNHGPSTAVNKVVSDPLPEALTFVSSSAGCSEAGGTVSCTIDSLEVGASQTFEVRVRVASSARDCDDVRNTATVSGGTPDPEPSNNTSTICNFERRADLSLSKAASSATVAQGGQVMYTMVVKNNGPSDEPNAVVKDPVPAGLTLVSAEPAQGSCSTANNTLECDLGSLVAGGSTQILVTATLSGTECVTNTARVGGDAFDPNLANNTDEARVCPLEGPPARFDLVVSKSVNKKNPLVGETVRYRVVVRNNGPDAAPSVTVKDTLNAPVTVVSVKASQGSCTKRIPMTCELGTIQSGGRVTITIRARHLEPASGDCSRRGQRNAASATGAGTDTNPANNLDVVRVCPKVELGLTKKVSTGVVRAGETFSYTIRTNNPASVAVHRVRTCDRLPAGLVFVSANPKAKLSRGQRCWTARTIGAGKAKTYKVTVRALSGASGNLVNRATASSPDTRTGQVRRRVQVIGDPAPPPTPTG